MLDSLYKDDIEVTRLAWYVDEASEDEAAGPDSGRASIVEALEYVSPGISGQAWRAAGDIDPTYGRLEASLTSDTGPWTDIGAGSLADPSAAGTPKTLWIRYVAHRWETQVNPSERFELGLYARRTAPLDEA